MRPLTLVATSLFLFAACGSDNNPEPAPMSDGEAVYRTPLADGNVFTCATCHALSEPAADGIRRPGHPIGNATRRATFKGGTLTEFRDAVNNCVTDWMNGDAWPETDSRLSALRDFLEEQATLELDADVPQMIVDPPTDLTGGDIARGQETFNETCVVCHGTDAVGTMMAPPLRGGRELTLEYIAERVRHSGSPSSDVYPGLTGGIMPFWSEDRLSDPELLNVVAFVNMISREAVPDAGAVDAGTPDADTPEDGGMPDASSECASTHPRVGQVATFQTRFHDVAGTAHILDDCTIELRDFVFDGTGVDVRLYGGLGGDFEGGVSIGDDLRRSGGYSRDTVRLVLPSTATLDDLDGVSIWCVPVGVSFGDGQFE